MTRAPTTLRLADDVREGMQSLKDRWGVPFTTQANLALRAWLKQQKGVLKKPSAKK